jgi:hypothetical protein
MLHSAKSALADIVEHLEESSAAHWQNAILRWVPMINRRFMQTFRYRLKENRLCCGIL